MKKIIFLVLIIINGSLIGQISQGTWRDHFAFNNIFTGFELKNGQIVGVSDNGLLYLNDDGSLQKFTKVNGLSDINLSSANYSKETNSIVVGYKNGNIDIINNNIVTNIADVKLKNIAADKTINNITSHGNYAYLSCGIGVIVVDILKKEIINTYYMSETSIPTKVYNIAIKDNKIYAATEKRLKIADLNDDLLDFSNWNTVTFLGISMITDVINFNNSIYLITKDDSGNNYTLQLLEGNSLSIVKEWIASNSKLFCSNEELYLTSSGAIQIFNKNNTLIKVISQYSDGEKTDSQFVCSISGQRLFIGDTKKGFAIRNKNNKDDFYLQKGVFANDAVEISSLNGVTIATRGGHVKPTANAWNTAYYSIFDGVEWNNIIKQDVFDYYSILRNESDDNHFYIGAWGDGIYEYKNNEIINHFDETNSQLTSLLAKDYCRISAMAYDKKKNIWITNAGENPLKILKNDGTWETVIIKQTLPGDNVEDILISSTNLVFVLFPNNGMLILDNNNTIDNDNDDIAKFFYPYDSEGKTIGKDIISIAEDKNGDIWFGTDQGVGVFFSPSNFNKPNFRASRIKITANLNDSLITGYLLNEEQVLSIAVDGGNRKWLGSANSGAYLMNDNGTIELLHFSVENSPLPSNKINSISVDNKTGEVFFATPEGIVSYKGNAIETGANFGDIYVYPNPIRHDYSGEITIMGLVYETNVKITDIAGDIVYETTSNGGMATWDGNNFSGQRVQTGIYLVFCSNKDGSETFVTKLLFIN